MAASDFTLFGAAIEGIAKALIDLDGGTFVATLHDDTWTPDDDTDATWADVSASELATAGGYTAGGIALSSVTVSRSGGTVKFDAADLSWSSATLTATYLVVTLRAGGSLASGDLLLGYVELNVGGSVSPSNADLDVAWNAGGIFTLARAS